MGGINPLPVNLLGAGLSHRVLVKKPERLKA